MMMRQLMSSHTSSLFWYMRKRKSWYCFPCDGAENEGKYGAIFAIWGLRAGVELRNRFLTSVVCENQ